MFLHFIYLVVGFLLLGILVKSDKEKRNNIKFPVSTISHRIHLACLSHFTVFKTHKMSDKGEWTYEAKYLHAIVSTDNIQEEFFPIPIPFLCVFVCCGNTKAHINLHFITSTCLSRKCVCLCVCVVFQKMTFAYLAFM